MNEFNILCLNNTVAGGIVCLEPKGPIEGTILNIMLLQLSVNNENCKRRTVKI